MVEVVYFQKPHPFAIKLGWAEREILRYRMPWLWLARLSTFFGPRVHSAFGTVRYEIWKV